jgi:hypothetical protein
MSITALSSAMTAMPLSHTPEGKEGPGPDHDGDADDKGISAATSAMPAALPQGMGGVVNTKA